MELTPELAAAAEPVMGVPGGLPTGADSGAPRPPYNPPAQQQDTSMPEPLQTPAPTSPLGYSGRFAQALDLNAADPAAKAALTQPGGFSRALLAAGTAALHPNGTFAQKLSGAMQNIGASLGDANIGKIPEGGGALDGIARTMQNRGQRLSDEKKQSLEAQQTQTQIAHNQALTIQLQRNIYRQDEADRRENYGQGKAFVDNLRSGHDVQENVTQDDLTKMVKDSPDFMKTHYAYATSEVPVLDADGKPQIDKDGHTVHSPVYSVVSRQSRNEGGNIPVTDSMSAYFKKAGIEVPVGTRLGIDQLTSFQKKAQIVNDAFSTIEKANDQEMVAAQKTQLRNDVQAAAPYIATYPNNPLKGLGEAGQNAAAHVQSIQQQIGVLQKKNPNDPQIAQLQDQLKDFQAEQKTVANVITNGFTTEAKQQFTRDEEQARHDKADEQIRAQEAADRASDRLDKKKNDVAAKDWQDALKNSDFDADKAVQYMRRVHPESAATMTAAELAAGGTSATTTDEEGNKTTVKSRPAYFTKRPAQAPNVTPEENLSPAAAGFQKDQQAKSAADSQQKADEELAINGRPADPATIIRPRIGPMRNPFDNPAEQYLRQHPELNTPEQRAAVRAQAQKAQQSQGAVQVRDPRGVVHTFANQLQADHFKKLAGIQ